MNNQICRILSYHHIPNNGAFLFVDSLVKLFQREFQNSNFKVLDYKSTRLALYEFLKQFKIFQSIPLFYMQRAHMWNRFIQENLDLDKDIPRFMGDRRLQQHFLEHYDRIIVGMDVWCILNGTERPSFPNLFWLPEKSNLSKIAYAVSGYNSDPSLIRRYSKAIQKYIDEFDVIGSRDQFTHEFVQKLRTRSDGIVEKVPDPTFLYKIKNTGVGEKISALGVDLARPILGLLLFGQDKLSKDIHAHYRAKGYQILALSMYNPDADLNLGHVLNPYEWAEVFRYFSFCISDRFHGTIFCIKNQVPFISLEKEANLPLEQSKLFDLLNDFDLTVCYSNPSSENFEPVAFLNRADEIEQVWHESLKPIIGPKIQFAQERHREFMHKIKSELSWE